MKKEKKFLDELRNKLGNISTKDKDAIVLKYSNIIKEHKDNNERIIDILKGIGKVEEVANKEIEEYKKNNSFKYRFNNFLSKFKKEKKPNKKKTSKKKEDKDKPKNNSKPKISLKSILNKKDKIKKERKSLKEIFKQKEKKDKPKKELNGIKEFFSKFKRKKEDTLKDEINEVQEEIKSEISEVSEIVAEKKVFETKEERNRRIALKIIVVVITMVLLFAWLWITVIFIASIFAFLDGVKFYGLVITMAGLDLLVLSIIVLINKSLFNRRISRKWSFIFIIFFILVMASGIALGVKQIYDLDITSDVSEKYNMIKKSNSYNLPSDPDKKLFISFNSNYKTEYIIDYDNTLKDKVNIEVKYYECYYDYFVKKDTNNLYISLGLDIRDRISVYIDDFKDGKIYDNRELERYVVKITISENDKNRISIK